MKPRPSGWLAALAATALLAASPLSARAADQEVTIGYQTGVDPAKVAIADGAYEKATGWKISWRKFDTGADVIAAMASGDVAIGYVGSSPLAAGASRGLDIETILVADLIGEAEALVVRNGAGIAKPQDLVGKKVAVPFVSTTHYSLIAALKHWGIDPKQVQILNMRPPEIAAAFQRGDIDAAYVWDPALGKIKETGKVLTTSAEVAKWGAPTFDAYIALKGFAAKHPEFVTAFVRVTEQSYAQYRSNPAAWTASSPQAAKIVKLTGVKAEDVPALLTGSYFPLLDEQVSAELLGGGTVKAIAETARFLKEQGKIPATRDDYAPYVNASFAKAAAATN
jgi:taurine transport system substrate-binding protein